MHDVSGDVKGYILSKLLPGESPEALQPDTELIRSGVLDSLATLGLIAYLEERFGIELGPQDMDAGNLATIADIERLVRSRLPVRG
jgi:acyl carrier protein